VRFLLILKAVRDQILKLRYAATTCAATLGDIGSCPQKTAAIHGITTDCWRAQCAMCRRPVHRRAFRCRIHHQSACAASSNGGRSNASLRCHQLMAPAFHGRLFEQLEMQQGHRANSLKTFANTIGRGNKPLFATRPKLPIINCNRAGIAAPPGSACNTKCCEQPDDATHSHESRERAA